MNLDELINNFPKSLVKGTQEIIKKVSEDLRNKGLIRSIPSSRRRFKVLSTDGSNVIVERRGGAIALFSAVSIVYNYSDKKNKVDCILELDPSHTLFVILPKYAVVSRANTLMRAFEYLTTLSVLENDNEIDYVLLDGSFSSVLLDPMRIILPIYEDLRNLFINGIERARILTNISDEIKAKILELRYMDSFKSIMEFVARYYSIIEELLDAFMDKVPEGAKITLQHYIISVLEQSFAGMALSKLIETADRIKKPIIWISKDSESRILSKKYGIFGLFNDLTLLDFILKRNEYILLNDFIDIPPINERRLRFISEIGGRRVEIPIIARDLISSIYSGYGAYNVAYVKFGDLVTQLSYPVKLGAYLNDLDLFLSDLGNISKLGYPEPLIIVHYRTKINQKLIENISDGLYEKCREKRNDILCNALSDSGRKRIGL